MLRRTASTAVTCVALLLVAGGCTTAPAWQRVELPGDFRPASLASAGDGMIVGGQRAGRPSLLRVTGTTVGAGFALDPKEPAAEDAELIAGKPVIFGLRSAATGIEGVVWTRAGHTWTKHVEVDPSLVSNPDRVVSFSALDRIGDLLVAAGDEVGLAGGLNQRPSIWVGSPSGPWTQALLPVPSDLPPVPGQLSRATSVACTDSKGCWVAGWVRGRPAVWSLTIGAERAISVQQPTVLPGTPGAGTDPTALVALVAGRPVVATGAASPGLQLGCPDGWRTLTPPTGSVSVLQATSSGLYLISGDRLERLDPPRC